MRLDRATGEVDGAVRQGRFAGSELGDLGLGELLELLAEAGRTDPQSSSLLEAYLDRRFPDWREAAQEGPAAAGGAGMDEQQALDILGLQKGAGPDEIKEAHRRLMTKVHPDSGGSNFLAAQINRAKDLLLGAARSHGD
ncbi:MAG: DnaJ domain-containing protein [Geminicoccaceae bacterium]